MQNLPVHWSEGMFLRPQHFQAADRYWTEIFQESEQWDTPYHYGLRSVTISPEAVANSQLDVSLCEARFKDGTLASRTAGQGFPRVDLKAAFQTETSVDVYLAVPKLKMGQPNVGMDGAADLFRYLDRTLTIQDESAGGNDQEIGYRELNLRLLLSTQDTTGFELLPIARIKRAGDKEGTPQIDPDYFPPLLNVGAWEELSHGVIRVIYDLIGQKIDVIAQQVQSRGITLSSQHPGDLERVLMLHVLNQAYAHLGCLVFATGVHPFAAYSELCRVVGMLSIFGRARRVGELPHYDHDDLARIFRKVRTLIELLLGGVKDYEYERRDFVGAGTGMMQVRLESKWVSNDWRWYVGVQGSNITNKEIQDLVTIPGRLDWKVASSGRVDQAFKLRLPGLRLALVAQAPPELPASGDWLYHEINRDNEVEWAAVTRDLTLAVRFNEQIVANANELQGKTKLQVKLGDKRPELGFALFAVPKPETRSRP